MIIRRPTVDDVPEIYDIGKNYDFPVPDKFEDAAVIEKNGDIISFGVVRYNLEAIFVGIGGPRDKVESLKMLIPKAIMDARKRGLSDLYVFAQDKEFSKILVKHFGFREAKGVPLILDF